MLYVLLYVVVYSLELEHQYDVLQKNISYLILLRNLCSSSRFVAELIGFQGKTKEEAQYLWDEYKPGESAAMTSVQFQNLVRKGFECTLNVRQKKNLIGYIEPPCALDLGFWGGAAFCPAGERIVGAKLKVAGTKAVTNDAKEVDNTALNGVELFCDGSSNGDAAAA